MSLTAAWEVEIKAAWFHPLGIKKGMSWPIGHGVGLEIV
jgi:hypothetical protein